MLVFIEEEVLVRESPARYGDDKYRLRKTEKEVKGKR